MFTQHVAQLTRADIPDQELAIVAASGQMAIFQGETNDEKMKLLTHLAAAAVAGRGISRCRRTADSRPGFTADPY
jgi:hypothetical protein